MRFSLSTAQQNKQFARNEEEGSRYRDWGAPESLQRWYPRDLECPHAGEPWISSAESQRSGVAKPQPVTEPFLLNGDAMAALARLLERARAVGSANPSITFPRLRGADYRSLTPAEELAHWRRKK